MFEELLKLFRGCYLHARDLEGANQDDMHSSLYNQRWEFPVEQKYRTIDEWRIKSEVINTIILMK